MRGGVVERTKGFRLSIYFYSMTVCIVNGFSEKEIFCELSSEYHLECQPPDVQYGTGLILVSSKSARQIAVDTHGKSNSLLLPLTDGQSQMLYHRLLPF